MPGRHNVSNATAAIAVAHELGLADGIKKGLRPDSAASSAASPDRFDGTASRYFDDYGHHPVEIKAVLRAARDATKGRVIAIAQPHRFHAPARPVRRFFRLLQRRRHGDGRAGLHGRRRPDRRALRPTRWSRIRSGGHRDARYITGPEQIAPIVRELAKPGDFVVFLGAGNITQWAYALPKDLGGGTGA
jgi:UDP-N-acetylmuramate--alanine ligase